jgi:lipopolysaccharide/colanic/teichoic acid biosynthesis glycosyltransferase
MPAEAPEQRESTPAFGAPEGTSVWSTVYAPAKLIMDLGLGLLILLLCSPIMVIAAIAVRLTSSGPAFYTQTRTGKRGRPFRIYKIRTMYHNVESVSGIRWSTPGDTRITPVGRFLRRTHIDELPQLINVLRMEMSLVGPRPERPEIIAALEGPIPQFRDRLRVRPGVTGLAQLRLPADTDILGVRKKLTFDLHYIRNLGPWLDLRLIACTGLKVLGMPLNGTLSVLGVPGNEIFAETNGTPVRIGIARRMLSRLFQIVFCLFVLLIAHAGWRSYKYEIPLVSSVKSSARDLCLQCIQIGIWVYDPYQPKLARLEPSVSEEPEIADSKRIDEAMPLGTTLQIRGGSITATAIFNERITRSRYSFDYQPYDEPRLHELRRRYKLDEVIASAKTDLEAMIRMRNWGRSQFRRRDYQPYAENFDALEVLDRNYRDHGELASDGRFMNPCIFFPMLYCELMLSVGYSARLLSIDHGLVEVWSNDYRKWVLMDPEYNHYFDRDGIPLNFLELLEDNHSKGPSRVLLVRGEQWSGDESTTIVPHGISELTADIVVPWFDRRVYFYLRNDWMTNHYFPGHPRRSEASGVAFVHPDARPSRMTSEKLMQRTTTDRNDVYWTLNQSEIQVRPISDDLLHLAFNTVTPNFECFELVIDGGASIRSELKTFQWRIHPGENSLSVRTLNRFGIRGIQSAVRLNYSPQSDR